MTNPFHVFFPHIFYQPESFSLTAIATSARYTHMPAVASLCHREKTPVHKRFNPEKLIKHILSELGGTLFQRLGVNCLVIHASYLHIINCFLFSFPS